MAIRHAKLRNPLEVELLEDRTTPSAGLLGFDVNSGDWKLAAPNGDHLDVSTVGHWDPYNLTSIVHGDFDGDGDTDVAGWSNLGYWLVGRAGDDGQLLTEQWLRDWGANTSWKTAQVGDFDGDGRDDIVMYSSAGAWWVCRSTGSSFEPQKWTQFRTTSGWTSQVVGDFNNDGRSDVASYYSPNGEWWVSLSTGISFANSKWSTFSTKSGWTTQIVGDFNGDGSSDIANFYTPTGEWWISQSTGTGFQHSKWAAIGSTRFVSSAIYDFNADARADIAALDRAGRTWIFLSDGDRFAPILAAPNTSATDPAVRLHAADFDGNGQADLALLTRSGALLVGTFTGNAVTYTGLGTLGTGKWVSSFTTDVGKRNDGVFQPIVFRVSSSLYFVSPEDVARIRLDPAYFRTIFEAYQYRLRVRLGTPYRDFNDQAIAYSLATLVAYEAASYRGGADPEGFFPRPNSYTLPDILAVKKLTCNEYDYLATGLYRMVFPIEQDPDTTIQMIGFSKGPFGNHSQIVFTSGGVSLLCDPNLGLVAKTTLGDLFAGRRIPVTNIRQLVYRVESTAFMQRALVSFRSAVVTALLNGLYPRATYIYSIDLTDNTWV